MYINKRGKEIRAIDRMLESAYEQASKDSEASKKYEGLIKSLNEKIPPQIGRDGKPLQQVYSLDPKRVSKIVSKPDFNVGEYMKNIAKDVKVDVEMRVDTTPTGEMRILTKPKR